jgi:hypothetical protein
MSHYICKRLPLTNTLTRVKRTSDSKRDPQSQLLHSSNFAFSVGFLSHQTRLSRTSVHSSARMRIKLLLSPLHASSTMAYSPSTRYTRQHPMGKIPKLLTKQPRLGSRDAGPAWLSFSFLKSLGISFWMLFLECGNRWQEVC